MGPTDEDGQGVQLHSTVRVKDADRVEEYTIVGSVDVDAAHGRISVESPVGRALLGLGRGAEVEVKTPGGVRRLTVIDISPPRCSSLR